MLAFFAAVLHFLPVGAPLFAVLERTAAGSADFGGQLAFAQFSRKHVGNEEEDFTPNDQSTHEVLGNFDRGYANSRRNCCLGPTKQAYFQ